MAVPRVVVSGLGFVTSIGNDQAAVIASLWELRSGIERHNFIPGADLPIKVVGTIKEFDTTALQWAGWRWPEGYAFSRDALRGMPPHGLYALCASEQMITDGRLSAAELTAEDTGLFCASAGSPRLLRYYLNQIYESHGERIAPMGIVSAIAGTLNFNLAAHYGIRGAAGADKAVAIAIERARGPRRIGVARQGPHAVKGEN
jgi:3-oxoacyl-[acyl-carrier-protein] synthase-1